MAEVRLIDANAFRRCIDGWSDANYESDDFDFWEEEIYQSVLQLIDESKTINPATMEPLWHSPEDLPPLREESWEDDGVKTSYLISSPVIALLADRSMRICTFSRERSGDFWLDDGGTNYNHTIAYWMPLPPLPEEVRK